MARMDAGGAAAPATAFASPMIAFSNRGNVYTTAGGSFEISGQPTPEFGDINATYPDSFTTFSSPRLFAPLGSNVMDVLLTISGTTNVQAFSRGFGVVFTDVDLANTTTLEFFNASDASLGVFSAAGFDNGLSFLGVLFGHARVSRVRIASAPCWSVGAGVSDMPRRKAPRQGTPSRKSPRLPGPIPSIVHHNRLATA